jgi:hypothetical protein
MTKRKEEKAEDEHKEPKKDEMRESKLLLIKNIERQPKRSNQMNMLSSLVEYSPKMKSAVINANNLSHSPSRPRKMEKKKTA